VDRVAIRLLVEEAVAEYDGRSLTSSLPPLTDARRAARPVYDAVAGYGPLQRHLDDPTVEELWINERLTEGTRTDACLGKAGRERGVLLAEPTWSSRGAFTVTYGPSGR
jgi:Flp pilus assembly CpaF family ATPase